MWLTDINLFLIVIITVVNYPLLIYIIFICFIQIQYKVPSEEYESGKYCKCNSRQDSPPKEVPDETQKIMPCQ